MLSYLKSLSLQKQAYWTVSVIIASSLIYLLFNHEWLYPPPDLNDSIINNTYAYYYNFDYHNVNWYKAARIPWLISLHLLQKITGPYNLIPAITVLGWIGLGIVFFIFIKKIAGLRRAVIIFPWIFFFPQFIGYHSGGGSYHNYGSTFLFLVSLIFWTNGIQERKERDFFLSGFFLGSTLMVSLVHLNLLLMFPLIDLYVGHQIKVKRYLKGTLGIIFAFLFWGFCNKFYGRPFFPHYLQFKTLIDHVVQEPYTLSAWHTLKTFFFYHYRNILYMNFFWIIGLLLIFHISLKVKAKAVIRSYLFSIHSLFLFIYWIVLNEAGIQTLHPPDFVYPLQVPFFLSLALFIPDRNFEQKDLTLTLYSAAFLWLGSLFAYELTTRIEFYYFGHKILMFVFLGFIASANMLLANVRRSALIGYFFVMLFVYMMLNGENRSPISKCNYRKSSHDASIEIVETMSKSEPHPIHRLVYFIYGEEIEIPKGICNHLSKVPAFNIPLNAALIGGRSFHPDLHRKFLPKDLPEESFAAAKRDKNLVTVFGFGNDIFQQFENVAAGYGYTLQVVNEHQLPFMHTKFPLKMYRIYKE